MHIVGCGRCFETGRILWFEERFLLSCRLVYCDFQRAGLFITLKIFLLRQQVNT
ncbi:MAG: hypothetical protein ACTTKL_10220 [Treponema sp.]